MITDTKIKNSDLNESIRTERSKRKKAGDDIISNSDAGTSANDENEYLRCSVRAVRSEFPQS